MGRIPLPDMANNVFDAGRVAFEAGRAIGDEQQPVSELAGGKQAISSALQTIAGGVVGLSPEGISSVKDALINFSENLPGIDTTLRSGVSDFGALPEPPALPGGNEPSLSDIGNLLKGANPQAAMKETMEKLHLMSNLLSNIANMQHESLKGIAQNLRG